MRNKEKVRILYRNHVDNKQHENINIIHNSKEHPHRLSQLGVWRVSAVQFRRYSEQLKAKKTSQSPLGISPYTKIYNYNIISIHISDENYVLEINFTTLNKFGTFT